MIESMNVSPKLENETEKKYNLESTTLYMDGICQDDRVQATKTT